MANTCYDRGAITFAAPGRCVDIVVDLAEILYFDRAEEEIVFMLNEQFVWGPLFLPGLLHLFEGILHDRSSIGRGSPPS